MDMSEAIQEAYAYADPDVTIYETFEFTHDLWTGVDWDNDTIMLVNSPQSLLTNEGTYQPATIEAALPETESSVRGQMKITIDFLPKEFRKMLWAASQRPEPVYVYYRQYTSEGSSVEPEMELPVAMTVNSFEFTDEQTIVNALYPDLVNIIFGRRIMTASTLPGGRI